MKFLLVILILFITGCNKISLNLENIKSIKYNSTIINEEDFNSIKNELLNLRFKCKDESNIKGYPLKIITDNDVYNLFLSDNYIEFKYNNRYCFNQENYINKIYTIINDLEKIYNNNNFFSLFHTTQYEENKEDEIIKIDKNDNYIVINTEYNLYNFTINEIKLSNDEYDEINLIYNKAVMNSNTIVIRKKDLTNIKISFNNKYNHTVNIIPYIENETIKFNII